MPAKNRIKTYSENSYYHIYNRGVEKRIIFQDNQDYEVFLSYLKTYLTPKDESELRKKLHQPNLKNKEKDKIIKLLRLNNFSDTCKLLAYCLIPNHFHFLIYQTNADTIDRFMNSLCTRYSMYFNKKYKRVGPLYQDLYKAVLVTTDEYLLHLSRYIHYQANYDNRSLLKIPQPSSYPNYLGEITQSWVKPEEILSFFKNAAGYKKLSYRSFVEQNLEDDQILISPLLLE